MEIELKNLNEKDREFVEYTFRHDDRVYEILTRLDTALTEAKEDLEKAEADLLGFEIQNVKQFEENQALTAKLELLEKEKVCKK